jgi:hypothetical protein
MPFELSSSVEQTIISGERVRNGDHSDAHMSTFSHSSKEVILHCDLFLEKFTSIYHFMGGPNVMPLFLS